MLVEEIGIIHKIWTNTPEIRKNTQNSDKYSRQIRKTASAKFGKVLPKLPKHLVHGGKITFSNYGRRGGRPLPELVSHFSTM